MARLRIVEDSDDEAPQLTPFRGSLARPQASSVTGTTSKTASNSQDILGSNRKPLIVKQKTSSRTASGEKRLGRTQRALGVAQGNSLLVSRSTSESKPQYGGYSNIDLPEVKSTEKARKSPRKPTRDISNYLESENESGADLVEAKSDAFEDSEFDDFIVNDSASEVELRRPSRTPRKVESRQTTRQNRRRIIDTDSEDDDVEPLKYPDVVVLDTPAAKERSTTISRPSANDDKQLPSKKLLDDFFDEPTASLKFSPPVKRPNRKASDEVRFVTPPTSPSKSKTKLNSPSKFRPKIPPSPHRPSIDAFWSQETINDWNDQYSPQKDLKTLKEIPPSDDDDFSSPSGSPRKSPIKSPTKADKEQKKAFDAKKESLATSFLYDVDQVVTEGKVSSLAAATGGIKLTWSRKLNTTAGRANWKKETTKTANPDGSSTTCLRHNAMIELAEKVIDDEDRLLNVIAHEFCHLATFMISGVKDNPHGKEFKSWAAKVTKAFAHRNIEVTTKHTYAINFKFVWACTDCKLEYKRHSKSIDPKKHTCGSCSGRLEQIKPAPRAASGKSAEYQKFVKENYARVSGRLMEGGKKPPMAKVMAQLAKEYKEVKGVATATKLETTEVVDVEDEDVQLVVANSDDEELDLGNVSRKLDSLTLHT